MSDHILKNMACQTIFKMRILALRMKPVALWEFMFLKNNLTPKYIVSKPRTYEDINSAKKEESPRWAVTKAYQSLFLMCNAILIKKLGVYSKNHTCVMIAMFKHNLISENILTKIHKMLEKKDNLFVGLASKDSFYEEISQIRITRNKYLYFPKSLRNIKTPSNELVEEVRQLIQLLGEIE